jgi:hypothetical protein
MSDAAIVSGSIKSVTIHGREFPVDAQCDARLNIGDTKNTVVIFGSGKAGVTQELTGWTLMSVEVGISDDRGDLGFLAQAFNSVVGNVIPVSGLTIAAPPSGPDRGFLADVVELAELIPITVTLVDDTIYSGVGTIVSPVDTSTKTGLATLDLAGQGRMQKQ